MAVNKNFVVKNGLEVNDDLILANATNSRVGIGTSVPYYTLHVNGGIGATNLNVSGVSTFVGLSTFTDVWVGGAVTIGGNLSVTGDVSYDEVSGRNLNITGVGTITRVNATNVNVSGASTFTGIGTFGKSLYIDKDLNIGAGATVVGTLTVGGDLNVTGDLSYDEVTGRNISISGVGTITRLNTTNLVGTISTITRLNFTDAVGTSATITNLVGTSATITTLSGTTATFTTINATTVTGASVGVSSEGDYLGAGATLINFASSSGTAWTVIPAGTSGIATVTVTPGVSIGLAIALGG